MISAVNLQRKFILILLFLGGQFLGGKVVSFQAEKTIILSCLKLAAIAFCAVPKYAKMFVKPY